MILVLLTYTISNTITNSNISMTIELVATRNLTELESLATHVPNICGAPKVGSEFVYEASYCYRTVHAN